MIDTYIISNIVCAEKEKRAGCALFRDGIHDSITMYTYVEAQER